jgi:YVTN family beta-propeller protein
VVLILILIIDIRTTMRRTGSVMLCLLGAACGGSGGSTPDAGDAGAPTVSGVRSSSIAVSADGGLLYVVNADSDSVSILSTASRSLMHEVLLAGALPSLDADAGTFTPAVMPRALALAPSGNVLYVSGERSGRLYEIALDTAQVARSVEVGSEPFGLAVSAKGDAVFVACSQDATVVRVDTGTFAVSGSASVAFKPWALAWSPDGTQLLVTHFLSGTVSAVDPSALTVKAWSIADVAARGDRRLAHGQPRSLYDLAPRPGAQEIWVTHALLGTDTGQPMLDFESTAFPTLTVLRPDGTTKDTLSIDALDVPGVDGAFADVVSGPRAIVFTRDGQLAFVADANSEDVLVVDAQKRIEVSLLRPLPGHFPEGLALSPDEQTLYVDERNTGDVAVVKIERPSTGPRLTVDGTPIARLMSDPMPPAMRRGQHLFFSANSDEHPITKNHWIACATCHPEGRSDAVTWRFKQGPRDTPSNAGGVLGTGFLMRTADRARVQDYWQTIQDEQGGTLASGDPLLDDLAEFVNHALPPALPPKTDATKVALGRDVFNRPAVMCATCHLGPRFTDSASGNAGLALDGGVLLHDVGTCVSGGVWPDADHSDIDDDPRAACMFDTPSLNGLSDSAPYLHDGSAATLHDVLEKTRGRMGDITSLTADEEDALVEYLRSL